MPKLANLKKLAKFWQFHSRELPTMPKPILASRALYSASTSKA